MRELIKGGQMDGKANTCTPSRGGHLRPKMPLRRELCANDLGGNTEPRREKKPKTRRNVFGDLLLSLARDKWDREKIVGQAELESKACCSRAHGVIYSRPYALPDNGWRHAPGAAE